MVSPEHGASSERKTTDVDGLFGLAAKEANAIDDTPRCDAVKTAHNLIHADVVQDVMDPDTTRQLYGRTYGKQDSANIRRCSRQTSLTALSHSGCFL